MAEVTERLSDRGFVDESSPREATRGFDVTGLAAGDRENAAIAAVEAHDARTVYNAIHPEDTSSTLAVKGREPEIVAQGHWRVLVRYRVAETGQHPDNSQDKLSRPARLRFDFGVEQVRVDRDVDGNPIVVSSGNAPNPAPTAVRAVFSLVVRKWEPFFDATLATDMLGSVNSDKLVIDGTTIALAKQALLVEFAPTSFVELGSPQVEVQYRWRLRPPLDPSPGGDTGPFWVSILDQDVEGWAGDSTSNRVETQIFDPGNPPTPVNRPVRLNGLGVPMNSELQMGDGDGRPRQALSTPPDGAVKETRGSGDTEATFLWYRVQKLRSVSSLGLA